jgi:hypothetical protein
MYIVSVLEFYVYGVQTRQFGNRRILAEFSAVLKCAVYSGPIEGDSLVPQAPQKYFSNFLQFPLLFMEA